MNTARWILAAEILMLIFTAPAVSDTIITTSRQTFIGKITEETPEGVTIKTQSGVVTVPRPTIATLIKDSDSGTPKIVPEPIANNPQDARKAWDDAKAAITKADWVKAGSLLAGLLELPSTVFPQENRLAGSMALATCHLQIKDAKGAAKVFALRAGLVLAEADKRRLQATAEALESTNAVMGITINGQPVGTYDEAIAAAMGWKTTQLLAEAKDLGAKAVGLNDPLKLEAAGKRCIAKLEEADLFSPGFSLTHRKEVLTTIADNILQAAPKAIEACTEERKILSRYWMTSAADVKIALLYNRDVNKYLGRRQAAEDGLKNLKDFSAKMMLPELYTEREAAITPLLAQLEQLRYHEMVAGMPRQLMIAPRRFGS